MLSFSNSFQSCVLSSYKIKVSDSASRRFDSGEVRRQSRVEVPRWSLRFKMGGQWTLSAPLICAELNDRNERQSITVHFWVRELAMFTTVSGASGQIKSCSSITTILFASAMIRPIITKCCFLFTEIKLETNYYLSVLSRDFNVTAEKFNKPAFIFFYSRPETLILYF